MSVNGVSNSPLLERAVYGDQSRVPIGAPVITNNKAQTSKEIQALITGTDLTEPQLNQFETFGHEGKEAFREEDGNKLDFRQRVTPNDKLIAEWAYDPEDGCLVLVRTNKKEERVYGFMRQESFGRGATGPRGNPGLDGKDGYNGRDGNQGEQGCPGEQGQPGDPGLPGNEGNPGLIGLMGPTGCEGVTGDRGLVGPLGRPGFEGSRGLTGPSCADDRFGNKGPQGIAFGKGVLFGAAMLANPEAAIVGLDDDGIDAVAPPGGWDGSTLPPPTSVPTNPPPPPAASAGITLCTSFGNIKSSCGATANAWGVAWANYAGPGGTKGLSMLPKASQNTAFWPNSLVMCGRLAKNASYTFELSTPNGVASSLFLNCGIVLQTDYTGGTSRKTITLAADTQVRLRFLNNAPRIPTWCALKIYDGTTGALLYATGKNASNSGLTGAAAAYSSDPNWRSNSSVQQYN